MNTKKMKFSVCMSVYINDNPDHFVKAVESIINQTITPDEVVIVIDGPIVEKIRSIISEYELKYNYFKIIELDENKGHARARQAAIDATGYEIIALMDSDDVSNPERFEKQLQLFLEDNEVSVVGGQISEFIDKIDNIVGIRKVPLHDFEIKEYLKKRCPFNQVTVMMRKSDVNLVGGYIDWHYEEDYYLWIRMFEHEYKFANLPDTLVNVRVGKEMYERRGGIKYFLSEYRLQKYMYDKEIISFTQLSINTIVRFIVQVIIPNKLRTVIFQKLFRN